MTISLSGLRKAAIVLKSLEPSVATQLLAEMDSPSRAAVTEEIAKLDRVAAEEQEQVIRELKQSRTSAAAQTAEPSDTKDLLALSNQASPPLAQIPALATEPAQDVYESGFRTPRPSWEPSPTGARVPRGLRKGADAAAREKEGGQAPFEFLHDLPVQTLCQIAGGEHARVLALILNHLPTDHASQVLEALPESLQSDVVRRMTTPETFHPELVREVEERLKRRLRECPEGKGMDGISKAAELLHRTDRNTAGKILATLRGEDPSLAARLGKKKPLDFQDLQRVDDATLRVAVNHAQTTELALALQGSFPQMAQRCLGLLPSSVAAEVKRTMQEQGPVSLRDIDAAQGALLEIVEEVIAKP